MSPKQQTLTRFRMHGAVVREILSGYARAAAVIERERMERMERMTPEEARAIYDYLCRSWATRGKAHDLGRLEQWRLETLLAMREAMSRLSLREEGSERGSRHRHSSSRSGRIA